MTFQLELSSTDCDQNACRIILSVGDLKVQSYPQMIECHFRDLVANRYFLLERKLSKIFFGDEPILNVIYLDRNLAQAYLYKHGKFGNKKIIENFLVEDAISEIDDTINDIITDLSISDFARLTILDQVANDISIGVYDIYLSTQTTS